jgi:pyruvate formate lyase activating enzyme
MILNSPSSLITGTILRFERASIHDGQGLRTVLFLKGCPLHCPWCSTPESRDLQPQRGYIQELCKLCGKCVTDCPELALELNETEKTVICDPERCRLCFKCVTACPQNAIKKYGFNLTVPETVEQIRKDEIFYFHSGGGLTISGGEPFFQPEFTAAILQECKKLGIHTAVESCMHVPFDMIAMSLPWIDHLYADLKQMDKRLHQLWLGKDNLLILENIKRVDASGFPVAVTIRLPLIPGFNDSNQNLKETVEFCASLVNIRAIEILPYHRLGSATYRHLGLDYPCQNIIPPGHKYLTERVNYLQQLAGKLPVKSGSGLNVT